MSAAPTGPQIYIPLDKSPQSLSLTVRVLLQRVLSGGIRIPDFQRPLRWRAEDVVKLFDSIARGYPIGSLLFWKRPALRDDGYKLGGAALPVPENPDAWWIVDGQQRVTALSAALLALEHGKDARWVVRYDPATREFRSGPVPIEGQGREVPLSVLGDLRRLGRWFRDTQLDDDPQKHVEDVQQRILDYPLSAYLMETDNPDALQGVFARMNSTGVRMRADEVFQALLKTPSPGHGGIDLEALQAACDRDGFGQPPRGEVLKAVLAMSGLDPTQRPDVFSDQALAGLVNKEEAELALARAVAFLQAPPDAAEPGCGIPCYAFIPYPVVFVLLARWFYVFPDPDRLSRKDLAHWVWRGAITAAHQRAAVSALRLQVRLIAQDQTEAQVLGALLNKVGEPSAVDWRLERFTAQNAKSRIELLALLSLGPRYPNGPVSWRALVTSGERVAREIFRDAKQSHPLAVTAANRVLLDAQYWGLRAELCRWDWQKEPDRTALQSHLIDEEMWRLLATAEGAADFLSARAVKLRALVGRFLTERANLHGPRLAPVESYADTEPELPYEDPPDDPYDDPHDDHLAADEPSEP